MKKIIRLTESDLHNIVKETVNRILRENDEDMNGTDEEFNDFMKWAMTDGNDYGFGDAAGEYVNNGDPTKLYNVAMQYANITKMHTEKAFNMAKEAAEGIYGFVNDMGNDAIDTRDMEIN
jgi:hypothetical protein